MTYLNPEKKLCFIHIAKNGGRSITQFLEKSIGPAYLNSGHHTYFEMEKKYKDDFAQWECFSVIRNPVDRVCSAFRAFKDLPDVSFEQFVEYIDDCKFKSRFWKKGVWNNHSCPPLSMSARMKDPSSIPPAHIVPQTFYFDLKYHNINLYSFDHVFSPGFLANKLGILDNDVNNISHIGKTSGQGALSSDISTDLIEKIQDIYFEDCELYLALMKDYSL